MRQALASRTITAGGSAKAAWPPTPPRKIVARFPQFEIVECLGRGGMGLVYKARQKSLDRWVAIKILAPERVGDAEIADRFAREARTLARLNHPNIVTVYDHGETGGLFYIVMEFVDGVNLRDLLRDGKLPSRQALGIVPPVCEALQFAHNQAIVHRDIKPENLLLDRNGRVKIADFGIATLMGAVGGPAGTPPYMAPEQAAAEETDHRADIHALGVVLYEMLTGERPGTDFVPPSRKTALNPHIDKMVMRAMEKDPAHRFRTASIKVRQTDPETAAQIVQGVVDVYRNNSRSQMIEHQRPAIPKYPVSPHLRLNLLLGGLAGLLASPFLALLLMLMLHGISKRRANRKING